MKITDYIFITYNSNKFYALHSEKKQNYTLVNFSVSKLDSCIATELKAEFTNLSNNENKNLVINLESVQYCDSSGLSAILIANRLCKQNEGTLVIYGLQAPVKKLIEISQLYALLNCCDTLEEAEKKVESIKS